MKVQELRNYGRDYVAIMTDPHLTKRMDRAMSKEFLRELRLLGVIRMMWRMRGETERSKSLDWSDLEKRGLRDQEFLDGVIHSTTAMKVLADMMGMEEASATFRRVWDRVATSHGRPRAARPRSAPIVRVTSLIFQSVPIWSSHCL